MSKEFLRRLPLFAGLSDLDLDQLYEMAEPVTLAEDEFLITEGDIGDALYVVLDGEVEITRRSGAQELVLAVKGSGEVLGEMALLEQAPRNASVKTLC
ncbi:MAG TPA: cyclic nucleotide-binding domain-containing protein, partial [Ardenticatenaceae bacterium]|nr:cyclic nucleotide-binding domain-containing protein [Ardenticatenaceae bacterium]